MFHVKHRDLFFRSFYLKLLVDYSAGFAGWLLPPELVDGFVPFSVPPCFAFDVTSGLLVSAPSFVVGAGTDCEPCCVVVPAFSLIIEFSTGTVLPAKIPRAMDVTMNVTAAPIVILLKNVLAPELPNSV